VVAGGLGGVVRVRECGVGERSTGVPASRGVFSWGHIVALGGGCGEGGGGWRSAVASSCVR